MIPPIKETAKKKRQLMKPVINENDKKRNHQLWNMTKKETVNFRYRILETGNFQIHEKNENFINETDISSDSLKNEKLMVATLLSMKIDNCPRY